MNFRLTLRLLGLLTLLLAGSMVTCLLWAWLDGDGTSGTALGFSILAGLLIIISSVFATRFARTREAVYYKVLGAKSTFVIKVFGLENFFLGMVSALIALALSQCASWIITTQVFNIAYKPFIFASVGLILTMGLIVIVFGLLPSLSVLKQKPVMFLREQTRE